MQLFECSSVKFTFNKKDVLKRLLGLTSLYLRGLGIVIIRKFISQLNTNIFF